MAKKETTASKKTTAAKKKATSAKKQPTTAKRKTKGDKAIEKEKILPFMWVNHEKYASLILEAGYKDELFENAGLEASGYGWEALAVVFINEKMPKLKEIIEFDSEAGMFCAYSSHKAGLKRFAHSFKEACKDEDLMRDLLSRAED